MPQKKFTVIGVTGQPGSGKDTAADYIASRGYLKISGGDVIREKMTQLGMPTDRTHVYEFIKKERERYGNGYPSDEIIQKIRSNTVVAGFRNLEEVRIFRKAFGKQFLLVAVDAPVRLRYERTKGRNRFGDDITFEQFKIEEEQEHANTSGSHEVGEVMKVADLHILNDGSAEQLSKKVDEVLLRLT